MKCQASAVRSGKKRKDAAAKAQETPEVPENIHHSDVHADFGEFGPQMEIG